MTVRCRPMYTPALNLNCSPSPSAPPLPSPTYLLRVSAEMLPHCGAYEEAENLRKILKPSSALAEGASLDKSLAEVAL